MLAILAESALRSVVLGSVVWIGLNVLRVRNPHVHMTSWVMVLVASLSMPILMHWTTVTVTSDAVPLAASENLWSVQNPLPEPMNPQLGAEHPISAVARADIHRAFDWWTLATAIYAFVAGLLLLRLAIGIYLTWRMVRAAKPISDPWAARSKVRVSDVISGPVTFGSTILLPLQCSGWDLPKRQAVLAHEGAHVANRDFYVLLMASLNRALFWFSPFAWWQLTRLAELAEIISDARALEVVDDKLSYAEILLDFVQNNRQVPAGLEMARACTVRTRIERILAGTVAPAKADWQKRIWTTAALLPVVVVTAGSITYRAPPASGFAADTRSAASAEAEGRNSSPVSFYALDRNSIFAVFREGGDVFGQLTGQRKLQLSVQRDGTYSYPARDGQINFALGVDREPSELLLSRNGRKSRAGRVARLSEQANMPDATKLDSYGGWYELNPYRVLAVTSDGARIHLQVTGRSKFEVTARGLDAFSSATDDVVIFLRDASDQVTQVLVQDPLFGARLAPRVDAGRAKMIEEEFARRVAEAPDRFREQAPRPGSREAVLQGIDEMQRGTPSYDRMSAPLAATIRRELPQFHPMFKALGAVESIFFRGVGPGGYDIYGVKFANGSAEFRILLAVDGKAVEDVTFRPDGNDAPGGVVDCSGESGLKSQGETAPIKLLFYNTSGADIRLYTLDSGGRRVARGMLGDNMSSWILTYVDNPWVITDASGNCLEVVQPGQRTRFNNVEAPRTANQPEQRVAQRTAPLLGSEEKLRRYIETLSRGEPDYGHMTPEVAAQTRRDLPFDQAILSRLGALRAVTFRGATMFGMDIYMAHFANGSAEWRIGLAKDGTIGRIALGPQS